MLKQSRDTTLRQRADAATVLMQQLKELERQGDQAMAAGSAFVSAFLQARTDMQLAPLFGHEAVASLAAANAAFASGMGHVVAAHRHMRELPGQLGLQPLGFGDTEPCPPAIAPAEAPQLRAVG